MNEDTTRERLMKIETTLEYIKDAQDNNKNEHQEILAKLDEIDKRNEKRIQERIQEFDKKYADKLVEKIVYGLVALILTAVTTAIIYLVIK